MRLMRALAGFALAAGFVVTLAVGVKAAEVAIPPPPTQWATDPGGLLTPATRAALNERLRTYEQRTGHQILVWIGSTTGDTPIEDWSNRAFERWKVGRKGLDDGLVLFIFTKDRRDRIEVGYGLEPIVPDVIASRILRETLEPQLAAGNPDRAVTGAVDRILLAIGSPPQTGSSPAATTNAPGDAVDVSPLVLVLIGLALIGFLVLF
ncbi:MAG: TPM domain-containing protein, partial [Vulcanimicrobiaceae bacterium]